MFAVQFFLETRVGGAEKQEKEGSFYGHMAPVGLRRHTRRPWQAHDKHMTSTWQAHVLQVSRLSFDHFLKHIHVLCHSFSNIYIHSHIHIHILFMMITTITMMMIILYTDWLIIMMITMINTDWLIIMITMITIIIKIKIISSSSSPHSGPVLRRAMTDSWRPILQQLTNELERQTQRLRELEAQRLVDLSVSWNHGRAWPGWPVFCGTSFWKIGDGGGFEDKMGVWHDLTLFF